MNALRKLNSVQRAAVLMILGGFALNIGAALWAFAKGPQWLVALTFFCLGITATLTVHLVAGVYQALRHPDRVLNYQARAGRP